MSIDYFVSIVLSSKRSYVCYSLKIRRDVHEQRHIHPRLRTRGANEAKKALRPIGVWATNFAGEWDVEAMSFPAFYNNLHVLVKTSDCEEVLVNILEIR
jgi:hypothetical protein